MRSIIARQAARKKENGKNKKNIPPEADRLDKKNNPDPSQSIGMHGNSILLLLMLTFCSVSAQGLKGLQIGTFSLEKEMLFGEPIDIDNLEDINNTLEKRIKLQIKSKLSLGLNSENIDKSRFELFNMIKQINSFSSENDLVFIHVIGDWIFDAVNQDYSIVVNDSMHFPMSYFLNFLKFTSAKNIFFILMTSSPPDLSIYNLASSINSYKTGKNIFILRPTEQNKINDLLELYLDVCDELDEDSPMDNDKNKIITTAELIEFYEFMLKDVGINFTRYNLQETENIEFKYVGN